MNKLMVRVAMAVSIRASGWMLLNSFSMQGLEEEEQPFLNIFCQREQEVLLMMLLLD